MRMLSALSWVGDATGARQLQHCTLNPPPHPSQRFLLPPHQAYIFFKSFIRDLGHIFSNTNPSVTLWTAAVSQHRVELIYFNLTICLYNLLEIFYKEK